MVTVKASFVRSRSPLFMLEAEVIQNGAVCARATAKFMRADVWSDTSNEPGRSAKTGSTPRTWQWTR